MASDSESKRLTVRIKLNEGKAAQLFAHVQSVYKLKSNLSNAESRAMFIAQASVIDQLKDRYEALVDEINLFNLELNPDYNINYQALSSFQDLYAVIKRTLQNIEDKPSTSSSPVESKRDVIKIPRIELPTFDGNIQNFPYFFETFKRVIHNNTSLTDSDRVHYLLSHLTGKAKEIAVGLVPSSENYSVILEALIAKYEDKRALATTYLNDLFQLKPLPNHPSPAALETLLDRYSAIIAGLSQLKIDHLADLIFIHFGLRILDSDTVKAYEMEIRSSTKMPRYSDFIKFVQGQAKILSRTANRSQPSSYTKSADPVKPSKGSHVTKAHVGTVAEATCDMCNKSHASLYSCNKFRAMAPAERYEIVKRNRLCLNCLSDQHIVKKCPSKKVCQKCSSKHHTWLHFPTEDASSNQSARASTSQQPADQPTVVGKSVSSLCTLSSTRKAAAVTEVLATAKVVVTQPGNRTTLIRCLIDPGSQKHYITIDCCHRLGLPIKRSKIASVQGIGGMNQPIRGSTVVRFASQFNRQREYSVEALVLDGCITSCLPIEPIDPGVAHKFQELNLADDLWNIPGEIEMLLGVTLFAKLLKPGGSMESDGQGLDALDTVLGYVIMGEAPARSTAVASHSFLSVQSENLDSLIRKFWETESVEGCATASKEDDECEKLYVATTTRNSDGRYEVALPFQQSPECLGDSVEQAKRRLLALERRLKAHPEQKLLYDQVINDYLGKGYLTPVSTPPNISDRNQYVIPHHGVVREDKSTTKLRVVLDASARTTSGHSLNDILHSGPSLQADLFTILINLRLFPIAISADVRQMYLQILMREQDRRYQRILYRLDPEDSIQHYEFNRVSFGIKSSPFLALRTVKQLAVDEQERYPLAYDVVNRDIYMDDIASSVIDQELAIQTSEQLVSMFRAGGFELAKWTSNNVNVLEHIPPDLRLSNIVDFDKEGSTRILGLCWDPTLDCFSFEVRVQEHICTKRTMLSSIARIFDVLGLVAPVVLKVKLLIKALWMLNIDWDARPPDAIVEQWERFQAEVPLLASFKIPRHIGVAHNAILTIVGFADASESAMGAVVYTHVTLPGGEIVVSLLCAKSKVAPVKFVTLARLELCAALMLSTLLGRVISCYESRYAIDSVVAFSDSTVALSWIHSSPHRWQTFVANRIAKIQETIAPNCFWHVKGTENPSDCLSRGITPKQLLDHPMWLHGPDWLKYPKHAWPVSPFSPAEENLEVPESKPVALISAKISYSELIRLSERYSSWMKILRVVCWIFKFGKRLPSGVITAADLQFAEHRIIMALQVASFPKDLISLQSGNSCSVALRNLNPFLENGLIRVGGRLEHSSEIYDAKHTILWPRTGHLVNVIVDYYHRRNFLHTLQARHKWNTPTCPIAEGCVVLVMQDNSPPLHWPLGVIVKTYPGTDGVVRVASVRTSTGVFKRPVVKLCALPSQ